MEEQINGMIAQSDPNLLCSVMPLISTLSHAETQKFLMQRHWARQEHEGYFRGQAAPCENVFGHVRIVKAQIRLRIRAV